MGLNEILGNALVSLSSEHLLQSWTIYHEKSGHISVKIRFMAATDSVNHDNGIHYRRKSCQQVNRDRERGLAWRAARQQTTECDSQSACNEYSSSQSHETLVHGSSLATDSKTEKAVAPGDVSAGGPRIQTRSMTKSSTCTPEIARSHESGPLSDMSPTAEPLCMGNNSMIRDQDKSLLLLSIGSDSSSSCGSDLSIRNVCDRSSDHSIVSASGDGELSSSPQPVRTPGIEHHASQTPVEENTIDDTSDSDTEIPPPRSSKGPFCVFCWYYGKGAGRCAEHG